MKKPKPDPKDAGIYTADKGQPPSPPDMGSSPKPKPKKAYAKGGSVRGTGCATKGFKKARMY